MNEIDDLIAQAKADLRVVRATEFANEAYRQKLLSDVRTRIATLRRLKSPRPAQNALVSAVLNSLDLSLRDHAKIPPEALIRAAQRLVRDVFNAQRRKAVEARHRKPSKAKSNADKIRDRWATGRHPTKNHCVNWAVDNLKMTPDAARKALTNQPRPTRK